MRLIAIDGIIPNDDREAEEMIRPFCYRTVPVRVWSDLKSWLEAGMYVSAIQDIVRKEISEELADKLTVIESAWDHEGFAKLTSKRIADKIGREIADQIFEIAGEFEIKNGELRFLDRASPSPRMIAEILLKLCDLSEQIPSNNDVKWTIGAIMDHCMMIHGMVPAGSNSKWSTIGNRAKCNMAWKTFRAYPVNRFDLPFVHHYQSTKLPRSIDRTLVMRFAEKHKLVPLRFTQLCQGLKTGVIKDIDLEYIPKPTVDWFNSLTFDYKKPYLIIKDGKVMKAKYHLKYVKGPAIVVQGEQYIHVHQDGTHLYSAILPDKVKLSDQNTRPES